MCLNKRVVIGLAVVALVVLAADRSLFGRVWPLLVVAICPLSMVVMMKTMAAGQRPDARGPETTRPNDHDEVTGLRAEVDQLRAELEAQRSDGTITASGEGPSRAK